MENFRDFFVCSMLCLLFYFHLDLDCFGCSVLQGNFHFYRDIAFLLRNNISIFINLYCRFIGRCIGNLCNIIHIQLTAQFYGCLFSFVNRHIPRLWCLKMSTLNSTFFHVFIVLPFCTIRSLFYCIFSLLGSAIVRLPLLPTSHAPYFRSYASCFTSSSNSSPAE